jgi:uncharacterized membrane protein YqjE
MSGAFGTVALLLLVIILLPDLARVAQAAVPALFGVLVLLAIWNLATKPGRRRH